MLQHHIQRQIVSKLVFANTLRFSELQPDGVDNKLYNYHLKSLLQDKLVNKSEQGDYSLNPEGQRMWRLLTRSKKSLFTGAHSTLILIIRSGPEGRWLLYKRKTHPLIGQTGFMHVNPVPGVPILAEANTAVKLQTGLVCTFRVQCSGYFSLYKAGSLESYIHFDLLVCDNAVGELNPNYDLADFFWVDSLDLNMDGLIHSTKTLANAYLNNDNTFIDKTLRAN